MAKISQNRTTLGKRGFEAKDLGWENFFTDSIFALRVPQSLSVF